MTIDEELLSQATAATGLSRRATVEEALRLLVSVRGQAAGLRELKGLGWEDDLDGAERPSAEGFRARPRSRPATNLSPAPADVVRAERDRR